MGRQYSYVSPGPSPFSLRFSGLVSERFRHGDTISPRIAVLGEVDAHWREGHRLVQILRFEEVFHITRNRQPRALILEVDEGVGDRVAFLVGERILVVVEILQAVVCSGAARVADDCQRALPDWRLLPS